MTSSHRSGRSGTRVPRAAAAGGATTGRQDKQVWGLRVTTLAATIMLLAQIGLGIGIAQAVNVPAADNGAGIFVAIWRALANGPVALTAHAALGLLLIATAISAIIRAVLARRTAVLVTAVVGLAAVLVADVTGARFVGSGQNTDSTVMMVAGTVALVCYLVSLLLLRGRSRGRRAS